MRKVLTKLNFMLSKRLMFMELISTSCEKQRNGYLIWKIYKIVKTTTTFTIITHDALHSFVLAVHLLHPDDVIAEVESLEPALLVEQYQHAAASPVQALSKHLPERG